MNKTFNIKTLGCKVNQYESEAIEEIFKKHGFEKREGKADIYVINTCTVTNMSDRKSRQTISKVRRENKDAIIAVMGCYSQVKADEVKKIDGVDIVLGSRNKEEVVELCEKFIKDKTKTEDVESFTKSESIEDLTISKQADMTRAYIKIQDGCNMYCSYCLIPYARGNIASRDLVSIIDEAKRLRDNGYKEIVLTGIHVASYGKDFDINLSLIDVIEHIARIDGIERIRLSSMEPRHITKEFLVRMKNTKKACDHFHLSLQSGSNDILKLMNRKYDTDLYKKKVELIREVFPNAGITTDIIVGFPNETEKNHEETKKFVKEIEFSKTHLFKYSKRDGTKASYMKNQVDGNIKKQRSKELSEIEKENTRKFLKMQIGKTLSVLFETKTELDGYRSGYSTNYLRVHTKDDVDINEIKDVKITDYKKDYLIGKII